MSIPLLVAYGQGVGAIGADDLNTLTRSGALISDLNATVGLQNMTIYIIGGSAANDGFQGMFYWNSSWTGTPDNINSVQPFSVVQGAWIRVPVGGSPFPTTQPVAGSAIVWNNKGFLCVA